MLTACLLAAVLAQPLDTSKVKTTRSETTVAFEPSVVAPDGADITFEGAAEDRAVLHARFRAVAETVGLSGLTPPPPDSPLGQNAASPRPGGRGDEGPDVLQGAWRTVKGSATTWHFTAARYVSSREGPGCCPPCPCSSDGVCAPCVACRDEKSCVTTIRGVHLETSFTVVGRRLVTERVEVRRVSSSSRRDGPAPRPPGP